MKVIKQCEFCEKEMTTTQSRISDGRGKYCSKQCLNGSIGSPKELRQCEFCGKGRMVAQHQIKIGGGKYCSRQCHNDDRTKTLEQRFWSHVVKADGDACWFWNGKDTGYHPKLSYRHHSEGGIGVHVFSYQLHYGPVPKGKVVRHKCDKPSCVRPDHLTIGTPKQNSEDMVERGRVARGERQGAAKLTANQVIEIRANYVKRVTKQRDIAAKYGVSQGTIWQIVSGNYWKHI